MQCYARDTSSLVKNLCLLCLHRKTLEKQHSVIEKKYYQEALIISAQFIYITASLFLDTENTGRGSDNPKHRMQTQQPLLSIRNFPSN